MKRCRNIICFVTVLCLIVLPSTSVQSKRPSTSSITVPVTPYYQTDPRWGDYLYGNRDPMKKYGCGPTALSIVVSALTDQTITPPEMADWAAKHGYWRLRSGSLHSLIPEGSTAFGLHAEKLYLYTKESLSEIFEQKKLIVLLMGSGHFTDSGHFIVLHGIRSDGKVQIADPFSKAHTKQLWDLSLLKKELSKATDNGGPAWVISNPNSFS